MLDLRDTDKLALQRIASKTLPKGTIIWAYGSRVKGTSHDTSDLDLVVHFPNSISSLDATTILANFKESLQESNIPILIQVLDWDRIPESFQQNIKQNFVEIGY